MPGRLKRPSVPRITAHGLQIELEVVFNGEGLTLGILDCVSIQGSPRHQLAIYNDQPYSFEDDLFDTEMWRYPECSGESFDIARDNRKANPSLLARFRQIGYNNGMHFDIYPIGPLYLRLLHLPLNYSGARLQSRVGTSVTEALHHTTAVYIRTMPPSYSIIEAWAAIGTPSLTFYTSSKVEV